MPKNAKEEFKERLTELNEKKDELLLTIAKQGFKHEDFEKNLRSLRVLECKIAQVENRIKRIARNKKIFSGATLTVPTLISIHYSI